MTSLRLIAPLSLTSFVLFAGAFQEGGGGFINITNQSSFRFQSTLDLIAWLTLFHIYNVSTALLEKKKKHTFRCSRDDVRIKGKCT